MSALTGWLRRFRDRANAPRRRHVPPGMDALETRDLMSVNGFNSVVNVFPQVLPPNGRVITVAVSGTIASNRPTAPNAFFYVTDEYRSDEPHGAVALDPTPVKARVITPTYTLYSYAYAFTVNLQAKRSKNTPDGRHYDLFVGASDADGADGKTVRVLVPKTYQPPAGAAPVGPLIVKRRK